MNKYSNGNHPSLSRIAKLREEMINNGYDFVIINTADPHLSEGLSECDRAREYFSGFTGSAGSFLVSENEAFLWTDSRYYLQAKEELEYSEIVLMKDGQEDVPSINEYLSEHVWPGQVIGCDFRTISKKRLDELIKSCEEFAQVKNASSIINNCWEDKPKRDFKTVVAVNEADMGQNTFDKIAQVRKNIEANYVKGDKSYSYVISDLCSIMWLTNLRGNDIEFVPVAFSYMVIDRNVSTLYIKKSCLDISVINKLNEENIIVKDYGKFENELREIASDVVLIDFSTNNGMITSNLDEDCIVECDDYKLIKKYIKNPSEIKGMIEAHIIDAKAMIAFIMKVKDDAKNGISNNEYELGKYLDECRLSNEACDDLSFATICGFNENGAIVHYEATKEANRDFVTDGLLLVDSGGQYSCGTTDITRTIVLGNISDKAKRCYTAVLKGNLDLYMATFKEGIRGDNLDILARRPIWEEGYDYGHGTGHGVGCRLSVHEPYVSISYRSNLPIPLKEGMVVSDEPGIYLEGEFGIRLENVLRVVKKDDFLGFESLTLVPFDREGIIPEMLTQKEKECLNAYHENVYKIMKDKLDEKEIEWLKDACSPI